MNLLGSTQSLSGEAEKEADGLVARSFMSEDAKEGRLAFLGKRKPVFKGK